MIYQQSTLNAHDPSELNRDQIRQAGRYQNVEHFLGNKDGKDGLYLLTGTESIFIPLTKKSKAVNIVSKKNHLHSFYKHDQYYVELNEPGNAPIYLSISIGRPTGKNKESAVKNGSTVTSLFISFKPEQKKKYKQINATHSFDQNVRDQFKNMLQGRTQRMTSDYLLRKDVTHTSEDAHVLLGLLGEHSPIKPVPAKVFHDALTTCEGLFSKVDDQDRPLKDLVVAEIKKLKNESECTNCTRSGKPSSNSPAQSTGSAK